MDPIHHVFIHCRVQFITGSIRYIDYNHSISTTGSYSSQSAFPNFTKGPIHHAHHPLFHHRPFLPLLQIGPFNQRSPWTISFHSAQAPIHHSPLFSLTWAPTYHRPFSHRPPQTTSPCSPRSSTHHRLPLTISPSHHPVDNRLLFSLHSKYFKFLFLILCMLFCTNYKGINSCCCPKRFRLGDSLTKAVKTSVCYLGACDPWFCPFIVHKSCSMQ